MLRIDAIERVEAPRLSESSTKTGYVYTFGAPGHGKGPFDGYGGSFKNKIHSLINTAGTRTGFINEVRDVFNALVYYYEKGIGRQAQANAKTDEFKLFLYEIGEDTAVPRPAEEFDTMSTITKQYQFAVNNEGLLLSEGSVNPVPKLRLTRQRDGRSRNGVYDVPQGRITKELSRSGMIVSTTISGKWTKL